MPIHAHSGEVAHVLDDGRVKLQAMNYAWFLLNSEAAHNGERRASGFYDVDDLESTNLPTAVKEVCRRINRMNSVTRFYVNFGGKDPDRVAVKFKDEFDTVAMAKVRKLLTQAGLM